MEDNKALNVNEELHKRLITFLETNKIKLPANVENAIADVFDENDFTSDEDDMINIYFKEDLEDFLTDTICGKTLNVQISGGNSSGYIIDKYTYYGELSTVDAYDENIALYDGEDLINQLSYIERQELNKLEDIDDYCVVLMETTDFSMGQCNITQKLYIYIPRSGEGI